MLVYQRVSSILMGWQRVLNTIEHFSSCGLQVQFHGCSPCFLDLLLICGSWNHWNTIRYSKNGLHLLVFLHMIMGYHGTPFQNAWPGSPRQAQTMLTQLSEQSTSHEFIESKDHQPLGESLMGRHSCDFFVGQSGSVCWYFFAGYILCIYNKYVYRIIEGSLEVKLSIIWTDWKQRW